MAQKKPEKKNAPKKNQQAAYTSESAAVQIVAGLLLCAIAALIVMALYLGMPGDVFKSVRTLCYGSFGLPSMLLPLFFLWGGALLIISTRRKVKLRSFMLLLVMLFFATAFFELITSTGSQRQSLYDYLKTKDKIATNFGEYLDNAYKWSATQRNGGGVIGLLVGWPLQQFLGAILTAVLYMVIEIVLALILFRFDFKGFRGKVSVWREHRKEKNATRREEKERIAAEKKTIEAENA